MDGSTDLNSFLSRVEQLDIERNRQRPPTKPKPANLRYKYDDLQKAQDLLEGSYVSRNAHVMEPEGPISSLAFKSAYNYDKTFSPKKDKTKGNQHTASSYPVKRNLVVAETHRVSKFDDVSWNSSVVQGEKYIISKEDYDLLMTVKKAQNARVEGSSDSVLEDETTLFQKRGSQRPASRNGEQFEDRHKPQALSRQDRRNHLLLENDSDSDDAPPLPARSSTRSSATAVSGARKEQIVPNASTTRIQRPSESIKTAPLVAEMKSPGTTPEASSGSKKTAKQSIVYNIVDEPVDEFSEMFEKIRLSNKGTCGKSGENSKTAKVPPKPPLKRSDIVVLKTRTTKPSVRLENKSEDEDMEALAIRKSLRRAQTTPAQRDITPEALRAKAKLSKPAVPPKPKIDVPEAITKRQTLLKASTLPEKQLGMKNASSSSLKTSIEFQKQLIERINLTDKAAHIPVLTPVQKHSPTAITSNTSSRNNTLTKTRTKGPKRKLPTNVKKL